MAAAPPSRSDGPRHGVAANPAVGKPAPAAPPPPGSAAGAAGRRPPPPVRNSTSRETRRGRAASRRHRRLPVRLEGSRFGQGSPPSPRVPVHDLRSRPPRRVPAAPRTAGPGWGQPEVKVKIGVTIRVGVGASAPLAAGPRPELAGEGPVAQPCIARVLAWLHPAAGTQWGTQKCRCPHRPHCARPKVQSHTETQRGEEAEVAPGAASGGGAATRCHVGGPCAHRPGPALQTGAGSTGSTGSPSRVANKLRLSGVQVTLCQRRDPTAWSQS